MPTPRIDINLRKIAHNAKILNEFYAQKGIEIIGITKAVGGNPGIANTLLKSGIKILGDSRLLNIKRMRNAGVKAEFLLLRSPFLSQIKSVVKYADISLNSELSVIRKISRFALKQKINHKIILMIELGDLREGILPVNIEKTISQILDLKNIELIGIGTNLACLSGVKPNDENMELLSEIANNIEEKFKLSLKIISGGNSANYSWCKSTDNIGRINNLRIGESIFLGLDTLDREPIEGLYTDAFTLVTEVIESKIKQSVPVGDIAQDAFGNIPVLKNYGLKRRSILGIGKQDVNISGLTPLIDCDIIAASSDHTIVSSNTINLYVGDYVKFKINYEALLRTMTSHFISKNFISIMNTKEYCESIENKSINYKGKVLNKLINDENSPLVSLKETNFNLQFEPTFDKNYSYSVRIELIEKIGRISKKLEEENKQLIILSGWRSIGHQRKIWDNEFDYLQQKYPKKSIEEIINIVSQFVAPEDKSMYSTGGSVNVLIYDLNKKKVLDFGTNVGCKIELNKECYPNYPDISLTAKKNRRLLINLFENEGFVCSINEYWHFNYGNANWAIGKDEKTSIYDIIYK